MRIYHHLSLVEREILFAETKAGRSLREIGRILGRFHSTLSRELKRNTKYGRLYLPCKADQKAFKRGTKQRRKAPLKDPLIILYVREHLKRGWSPEEIAGRLPLDHPGYAVDDETIYRYIYRKENKKDKFWQYLPLARKKRMKKEGRKVRRLGKIPEAVPIDFRPKEVDLRRTIGHWETDNLEGKKKDQKVISTTVERLTRITILSKLLNQKAETKNQALIDRLSLYPEKLRRTMTADNGKENTNHRQITQKLGMEVYFCHAYHSWEKGTVENTNGRIRKFLPKGTSFNQITEEQLKAIENKLNNTPRKCLDFSTPYEKMREYLQEGI